MSYVKVWIHAVWATKNWEKQLKATYRKMIFNHMYRNAGEKNILIEEINGYSDHVHCLFRLRNDQTISKVVQLIKGESSYWINKNKFGGMKVKWQEEYYAISVNEVGVKNVKRYIQNQEEHHSKKSYKEEYDEFISKNGFIIKG
jgi:REP element-mobilizing transposase RayT